MPREFRFTVPSVPPRALSPNAYRKMHWSHKQKAREEMAHDWGMAIKGERGKKNQWNTPMFDGDVGLHLDIRWPPGRHPMDFDNLIPCFKRGVDQLQQQGILDDDFQIKRVSWTQEKDPEKKGYVEVVVTG